MVTIIITMHTDTPAFQPHGERAQHEVALVLERLARDIRYSLTGVKPPDHRVLRDSNGIPCGNLIIF